jgi:signal transduction histidine kinase
VLDRAIEALGRFARVVSDADVAQDVLGLLADALFEHVCPDGVVVYALEASGKLHSVAGRGLAACERVEVELDDVGTVADTLRAASGEPFAAHLNRPLVASGSLYGSVLMLWKDDASNPKLALAEGLIDLAAVALSTAAHIEQLERQFAELRAQQEMLARTEKLRALGQMAAGVSHDLKNILNPLSLHLQVITRSLDRGNTPDAKESAIEMKEVLQRGLQTLERLRDFSRQSKEAKSELVEVDKLAREALAIGKARAASGGGRLPKVKDELTSPQGVMAVSGEIVSALVNLVVNAIDAMSGNGAAGTITLRSGEDERGAWIEVGDDGPGMAPEVATRVFEPFFTTKGQEGTGLGLAMVYATMQRHGGTVTVDTAPGKGTRFRLSLPAAGPLSTNAMAAPPRK